MQGTGDIASDFLSFNYEEKISQPNQEELSACTPVSFINKRRAMLVVGVNCELFD